MRRFRHRAPCVFTSEPDELRRGLCLTGLAGPMDSSVLSSIANRSAETWARQRYCSRHDGEQPSRSFALMIFVRRSFLERSNNDGTSPRRVQEKCLRISF